MWVKNSVDPDQLASSELENPTILSTLFTEEALDMGESFQGYS